MPDNIPQWRCQARIRDLDVGLEIETDDAGVVEIAARVPAGTAFGDAASVFDDLVSSMDAFPDAHARLLRWIDAWDGARGLVSTEFDGGGASIESDATWIGLTVARVPRSFGPSVPIHGGGIRPVHATEAQPPFPGRFMPPAICS
jgi:hypothetical protein